jgi:multimeric flavodoxin WrbA
MRREALSTPAAMPLAARVLVVNASQRRSGNTAATLDLLRDEVLRLVSAEGLDARWDNVALADLCIEPCMGCRACFDLGESRCPRKDGLLALRDRILASRIVVLATPVYVNDVCGTMKTLVDRLAFVCHRPAFAGIGFCLVVTTGGSPTRHAIRTLEAAVLSWGGAITARLGLKTGALMNGEAIGRVHGEAIRRCARRLVPSLRGAVRPSFISLMVFRIQQRAWARETVDSLDRRFWKDRGWLDPSRTWFRLHRAGRLKTTLARLAGNVAEHFFAR